MSILTNEQIMQELDKVRSAIRMLAHMVANHDASSNDANIKIAGQYQRQVEMIVSSIEDKLK